MPKGKAKKSGKTKGSSARLQANKKGGGVIRKSAPAAVSTFVKQWMSFYGSGETLGLKGKIALFDVSTSGNVGTNNALIGSGAQGVYACRLSPTSPTTTTTAVAYSTAIGFISPALDLLGSAFTRYKVKKNLFHYLPLFTTNSTQQLIFGFAADPCHPLLSASTATVPTFSGIESLSDSRPFAPWDEWTMDVSKKLPKDWLYLSSNSGDTTAGSDTARFDNWGSIACVTSTAGTATAERYGVLYLEFDIEFKEFCPISVTRPALLRALSDKLMYHAQRTHHEGRKGVSQESSEISASFNDVQGSCSRVLTRSALLPTSHKGEGEKEVPVDPRPSMFSGICTPAKKLRMSSAEWTDELSLPSSREEGRERQEMPKGEGADPLSEPIEEVLSLAEFIKVLPGDVQSLVYDALSLTSRKRDSAQTE